MTETAPETQSSWGRIIRELADVGIGHRAIAAAIGCSVSRVSELRNDPRAEPRHSLGERLIAFHAAKTGAPLPERSRNWTRIPAKRVAA